MRTLVLIMTHKSPADVAFHYEWHKARLRSSDIIAVVNTRSCSGYPNYCRCIDIESIERYPLFPGTNLGRMNDNQLRVACDLVTDIQESHAIDNDCYKYDVVITMEPDTFVVEYDWDKRVYDYIMADTRRVLMPHLYWCRDLPVEKTHTFDALGTQMNRQTDGWSILSLVAMPTKAALWYSEATDKTQWHECEFLRTMKRGEFHAMQNPHIDKFRMLYRTANIEQQYIDAALADKTGAIHPIKNYDVMRQA